MMQLGFAMLESGLNASKNSVNVLFKNLIDISVGILIFFSFGYAIMFQPLDNTPPLIEFSNYWKISQTYIFLPNPVPRVGAEHIAPYIDFFFQAAFAVTAATICSGAVAGRMKPRAYLLLTCVMMGIVYPTSGYWVQNNGWLHQNGFRDFAGALIVHGVGGGASLASVMILKARIGRFENRDQLTSSQLRHFTGHSLPLATLGMFILWIGWYGFNLGNTLGIVGDGFSIELVGKIALNTTLSACAAASSVAILRKALNGKIELSMVIHGILGGLVAITASCDRVEPMESIVIGAIAALVVICGVHLLAALRIDDSVGAFPVHGLCGIWGGIATGIFTEANLQWQIIGSLVILLWSFTVVYIFFFIVSRFTTIRVSPEVEKEGLDYYEHGEIAYIHDEMGVSK